jgi:hypothetical protein
MGAAAPPVGADMMLMGILDRYIARVVLGGTLIALLVVLALDVFFSFIGEVGDIGRGNYHALDALAYIALTIPRRSMNCFPWPPCWAVSWAWACWPPTASWWPCARRAFPCAG